MDLEPWDPWREFDEIRTEVDRIFQQFFTKVQQTVGRRIAFFPTTDVIEDGEEFRILISLPGMVEEDIDIGIEGGTIMVRGEREIPYDPKRILSHHSEWSYGYFERRIEVPPDVDLKGLTATYEVGVLTITIPKKKD